MYNLCAADDKDFSHLWPSATTILQFTFYDSLLCISLMRTRSCSFHCSSEIAFAHGGMDVSGRVMVAITDLTSLILVASKSISERLCAHDHTSNTSEEL